MENNEEKKVPTERLLQKIGELTILRDIEIQHLIEKNQMLENTIKELSNKK